MKKGTFKFVLCGFDENAAMVGGFMVYFQNIRALDSILCIDTENFYSPQTNAAMHKSNMHQIGAGGINSEGKQGKRKKSGLVSA